MANTNRAMTIRRERRQEDQTVDQRRQFAALLNDFHAHRINRRNFLAKVTALLTLSSLPLAARIDTTSDDKHAGKALEEPWLTFAAVQDHLFPTTSNAPGAREIRATAYLERILSEAHTDPDDKEFIRNGVGWLNEIAQEKHGKMFHELAEDQREVALRQIEQSGAGERWLSLNLLYIFEALLSNPVYGANPDEIGWQWLAHQPGFPQPPADKTYSKL
jgi:gluconate 2-dehydrogenase gamma chain